VRPQQSHDGKIRICEEDVSLSIQFQYNIVRILPKSKLEENNLPQFSKKVIYFFLVCIINKRWWMIYGRRVTLYPIVPKLAHILEPPRTNMLPQFESETRRRVALVTHVDSRVQSNATLHEK